MKISPLETFTTHLRKLHRSPKTIKEYRRRLNRWHEYLQDHESGSSSLQVTSLELARYRDFLLNFGYCKLTVNSCLNTLSTFYRWAVKQDLIAHSPLNKVHYFKSDSKVSPRLEEKQVAQLRAWFDTLPMHLRASYYVMYGAGLTPEEAARLKSTDVWLKEGVLYIHTGRHECERTISVREEDAARVLYTYWSSQDQTAGSLFRVSSLDLYQHDLKFKAFPFHCRQLRKDFAIKQYENGLTLHKLQRVMGHTEILMTVHAVQHAHHDLDNIRPKFRLNLADRGKPA